MKNRKLALVITLVCALLLCGVSTGLAAKNTIKIGYFSDMSSADGYIGMAGYYALLDRAEELNANGGLLGKQIEVIGYDNAGKNEEVVNIVNKLCYADKVNVIIGPTSSSHAIAAAPVVNAAQIPMISLSATNAAGGSRRSDVPPPGQPSVRDAFFGNRTGSERSYFYGRTGC